VPVEFACVRAVGGVSVWRDSRNVCGCVFLGEFVYRGRGVYDDVWQEPVKPRPPPLSRCSICKKKKHACSEVSHGLLSIYFDFLLALFTFTQTTFSPDPDTHKNMWGPRVVFPCAVLNLIFIFFGPISFFGFLFVRCHGISPVLTPPYIPLFSPFEL